MTSSYLSALQAIITIVLLVLLPTDFKAQSARSIDLTSEHIECYDLYSIDSPDELAYLRNKIFAQHGQIFKSEKWKQEFQNATWYEPKSDSVILNEVSQRNVSTLLEYEDYLRNREVRDNMTDAFCALIRFAQKEDSINFSNFFDDKEQILLFNLLKRDIFSPWFILDYGESSEMEEESNFFDYGKINFQVNIEVGHREKHHLEVISEENLIQINHLETWGDFSSDFDCDYPTYESFCRWNLKWDNSRKKFSVEFFFIE